MKIYVAGPMRGYPNFNFPAFNAATARLRDDGHYVFNPAERDEHVHGPGVSDSKTGDLAEAEAKGFNLREALADDLDWVCREAEAVVVLPGWTASKGACAEVAAARALGLPVLNATTMESV